MTNSRHNANRWLTYCATSFLAVMTLGGTAQSADPGQLSENSSVRKDNATSAFVSSVDPIVPTQRYKNTVLPETATTKGDAALWRESSEDVVGEFLAATSSFFDVISTVVLAPVAFVLLAFCVQVVLNLFDRYRTRWRTTSLFHRETLFKSNKKSST